MQNLTSLRTHTSGSLTVSGLAQTPNAATNMIVLNQNQRIGNHQNIQNPIGPN